MRPKKKNRFIKVTAWIAGILLLNLVSFFILLQIPAIQTRLTQYLSRELSQRTGFEITVQDVDIDWLDRFKLKGLVVQDENDQQLLSLSSINVNYELSSLFNNEISLDNVIIKGLEFKLQKHASDTLNIIVLLNRIKKLSKAKQQSTAKSFYISNIYISQSNFYYQLDSSIQESRRFNPKNFSLTQIEADLSNLRVVSDTFQVQIEKLNTTEGFTQSSIKNLKGGYLISSHTMQFNELSSLLDDSQLKTNMVFSYDGYEGLSNFIEEVRIEAEINDSEITTEALSLFSPYFDRIHDRYKISGNFKGEVADFQIRNLNLGMGKGSNINGRLYFSGLPNIDETFIDLQLSKSTLIEDDLEQYINSKSFTDYNRFSQVGLNGSFTGYLEDFVAYGEFKTNMGTIISDINLKIGNKSRKTTYSGRLKLKEFELGSYTDNSALGKVSIEGELEGKGVTTNDASLTFKGNISQLEINNYSYTGITTDGKFEQEYFSGSLEIDDPNLKLNTVSEIDLRNQKQRIVVNGELLMAHPDQLNLISSVTQLNTKIEADIHGFALDSIEGYINLSNLRAENNEQALAIDTLRLNSRRTKNGRELDLITDRSTINIWGDFNYTPAIKDINFLISEFKYNLLNNTDSLDNFYASNSSSENGNDSYQINVKASFRNIDRFLNLFVPDLSLHSQTDIEANFRKGVTKSIALFITNDSLSYNGIIATNNELNIDASKVDGDRKILAAADFQSANQLLANGSALNDLLVSAVWNNNKIDFNWYNQQALLNNTNDLYGEITFFTDSTQIHFNRSQLSLLDEEWTIQDNNLITIKTSSIQIEDLNIGSKDQMLTISGNISKDPEDILAITANNLNVNTINPLISKNLSGRLSGEFAISSLFETPTIISNFYINELYINQFLVGNIYSSSDWSNDRKLFEIQFIVSRSDRPIILVSGIINPFDRQNTLNLSASFMNAKINIAEPFIETLFSNLKGNINGKVNIIGPLDSPQISGNGTLTRAGLRINYLNTSYDVQGTWKFDSSAIYLQNLILRDKNNSVGSLNGKFTHSAFKDFRIDLNATMQNFLVLNTTARDNDLFYGTGIASGTVGFTGPLEDITIKAKATTERGTRFFIPVGGSSSTELEEYISFVNFTDTLSTVEIKEEENVKITGLNLEFDLAITEDAYSEIIFDITSGDIIRGRGSGNLSMKIDTKGEFSMLGTYEFASGGYNFTMYNIVNKEFEIKPRSKITWSGDPYAGIMDIAASYKVTTSLAPLVDTVYHSMPDVKRIYPTEVLLGLNGPLLSPDIDFQIIIEDYPKSNVDLDTQIKGFLNTIAVDQQELNRQVFSLLILRKFSAPNSFSSSGTIGSSVSEFVSNQLSYWISQVDDNLTIDMELGDLDADALKTFQLRVSYEFMDGKLIITRDGGFTNPDNEASVGSIAGDWTLEYLLSEDGKLRVKLFNKTNYNQLNSTTGSASQALMSGGFSLIYTTSFDNFSDLFKPKKKSKQKSKKQEEASSSGLKPEEIGALIEN